VLKADYVLVLIDVDVIDEVKHNRKATRTCARWFQCVNGSVQSSNAVWKSSSFTESAPTANHCLPHSDVFPC
jgi:hypothetical protein